MRSENPLPTGDESAGTIPEPEALSTIVRNVIERDGPVRLTGLRGAARAIVVAHLVRAHAERPVLVLVPPQVQRPVLEQVVLRVLTGCRRSSWTPPQGLGRR